MRLGTLGYTRIVVLRVNGSSIPRCTANIGNAYSINVILSTREE